MIEIKQAFLLGAISDISSYIHLADAKVSLIMATMLALAAVVASLHEPIYCVFKNIRTRSCLGVTIIILSLLFFINFVATFVFGILTIRGHSTESQYKSKWFLHQSTKEYFFDMFKGDVNLMVDEDVIENMIYELYVLNDINQQKIRTNKWTICSFSLCLVC